jgi:hypothetical protein
MTEDSVGAFIPGERTMRPGAASGPLAGLSFAAKDLFDVAGTVTGYGNPDWAATHAPAIRDAVVITQLLQAGASLAGKTKTVELAYGLTGENVWQGTPKNPAAPDRFPAGLPAVLPRPLRRAWLISPWGRIRAVPCASPLPIVAFSAFGRAGARSA